MTTEQELEERTRQLEAQGRQLDEIKARVSAAEKSAREACASAETQRTLADRRRIVGQKLKAALEIAKSGQMGKEDAQNKLAMSISKCAQIAGLAEQRLVTIAALKRTLEIKNAQIANLQAQVSSG